MAEVGNDVRFVGRIPGRYALATRRGGQYGTEPLRCQTFGISPSFAAIMGPHIPRVGEQVAVNLDYLGLLKGLVSRQLEGGFTLNIEASPAETDRLAARIEWVKKKSLDMADDGRTHKRFLVRDPSTTVTLVDGRSVGAEILDASLCGVALTATATLPIGTAVAVGQIPGRVVRHFQSGFAVRFSRLQAVGSIERLLRWQTVLTQWGARLDEHTMWTESDLTTCEQDAPAETEPFMV